MYQLIDYVTQQVVSTDDLVFAGEKNPWEVVMDVGAIRRQINLDYFVTAQPKLSKYLPFMPIKHPGEFVSLRENATPLIKSKRIGPSLGVDLYFKLEGKNPTGSFKDRGSAVDISVAKEMGAKAVILASTGNMAASCSCYAAAANLPCFVVVPDGVPLSKLAQVLSYGGKIIQVKGTYNDAADVAYQAAKRHGFYLAGDYAFRVEGQKTAAFELADQLSFHVPDAVFVPIGCGTNITAYAKGFDEYQALGLIDSVPALVGVQSTGANAVVRSFRSGSGKIDRLDVVNTIATAIAVPDPIDGLKALGAINKTGGFACDVTDQAILEAQYLLSTTEGLFVESAGASTVAALMQEAKTADLSGKKIVCILTGDGLKDPDVVLKSATKPVTISPSVDEFSALYNSSFFDSDTMIFGDKKECLFDAVPSIEELKTVLSSRFSAQYDDHYTAKILSMCADFLSKGKDITVSDLQDIIQDVLEQVDDAGCAFKIIDFDVCSYKDKQSIASIDVLYDGQPYNGKSNGVGPVDAVIQSLHDACRDLFSFQLDDYRVDIRSDGPDAVVNVEMKLKTKGISSQGHCASPDIIQASLKAFENAYNGLILQQHSLDADK